MSLVFFVSGIHGVGKTTLCRLLMEELGADHYSCSELIKKRSDYIELSKHIDKVDDNQMVLLDAISAIKDDVYLLDGHFCLIDRNESVQIIDSSIFESMGLSCVVNVWCDDEVVYERLCARDGNSLSLEIITKMRIAEEKVSKEISQLLDIPYFSHNSLDEPGNLVAWLRNIMS